MRRSPLITVVMYLATGLLLGTLAAGPPASAQRVNSDGFSICAFSKSGGKLLQSEFGPCQALTDMAMRSFGLSASQAAIVATLQRFAADLSLDRPPSQAIASLAAPKQFAAVAAFSDYWLADPADAANVEVGVHLLYATEQDGMPRLSQMSYAVDGSAGHFSVLWNRVLALPSK